MFPFVLIHEACKSGQLICVEVFSEELVDSVVICLESLDQFELLLGQTYLCEIQSRPSQRPMAHPPRATIWQEKSLSNKAGERGSNLAGSAESVGVFRNNLTGAATSLSQELFSVKAVPVTTGLLFKRTSTQAPRQSASIGEADSVWGG